MNLHEMFNISELSPNTLSSYKKKAGAQASTADKVGDTAKADKRFGGIVKATKKEFNNDANGVKEASTINGRVQSNDELVWKQTSMGYEQAVEKYGKEHVKLGGKNRRGEETVEVHVPLVAESKERCPQCGMTNCTCSPGKCKCKPVAGWIPNKGFKKVAEQGVAEGNEPKDTYPQRKPPKHYDPDWIKKASKAELDSIAGKRYPKKDVAEAGRAAPDTDLKIGNRVVADLRKDKDTTIGNQYRSGIVSRVGQKGVHIKPDTRGDQEWHPYNVVKKIGMEEDMANRAESKAQRIAAFEQKAQQGDPAAIRYMEAMKAYDNRMNMARESTEVDEKVSDFLPTAHDNGKLVRGWRKDRGFTE
jgi:hypothetical protein